MSSFFIKSFGQLVRVRVCVCVVALVSKLKEFSLFSGTIGMPFAGIVAK